MEDQAKYAIFVFFVKIRKGPAEKVRNESAESRIRNRKYGIEKLLIIKI